MIRSTFISLLGFGLLVACGIQEANDERETAPPAESIEVSDDIGLPVAARKGEMCGGIAGILCEDDTLFCQYESGTCGVADAAGVCVSTEPQGCGEVYAPVCGCDGNTYGNLCEATNAQTSVAYEGECSAD